MSCLFASGLSIIGFIASEIFKRIKCRNEIGILTCSKSGLTTMINNISDKHGKCIFISIEDLLKNHLTTEEKQSIANLQTLKDENSIKNILLPKICEIKEKTRSVYKKKKIFYFSTDRFLLETMRLKKIIALLPSKSFHEKISCSITDDVKEKIRNQRSDILSSTFKTTTFESYEDLKHVFTVLFKLKSKV